jgi:hypothetical protein
VTETLRSRPVTQRPEAPHCPYGPAPLHNGIWAGYHCRHDKDLRTTYGPDVTCEFYWSLFEAQDGRCAVCRRKPSKRYRLCVDHDHDTGAIEGLCHKSCNLAITKWIRRYLRNPPGAAFGVKVSPEKMVKLEAKERERQLKRRETKKQLRAPRTGPPRRRRRGGRPPQVPQRTSNLRDKLRPTRVE